MKQSKNLTTDMLTSAVKDAVRTEYSLTAIPRLIVDWNLNRYSTPTATNTPSEDTDGFDIEVYPIESLIEPLRPTKGISKALVNQGTVSPGYIRAGAPRFYVSSEDDVYKTWTSPFTTNTVGTFPTHSDGKTTARPKVSYDRVLQANKIVIKLENTWASPKTHTVHIATTVGGAVNEVAIGGGNPAIANDGTLTLWYNGTAWTSFRPSNLVTTSVAAIEYRVQALGPGIKRNGQVMTYRKRVVPYDTQYSTTGFNSNLNVISIEAHLEADLTSKLIGVEDTFDISDPSQLYPIGTITTNTSSITLSNDDGTFNVENTSSPYYRLIEPNGEFNLEYVYTINGVRHSVQQFKMYASNWSNSEGTTTVELEDYSKYLQETKPRAMLIEKKTAVEIVWRVLDNVGFVDYEIDLEDTTDTTGTIPVFWTTGEETVWEVLDELAKATQTAIYMDAYGRLQVRTRRSAFKTENPIDWELLGAPSGTKLPDIISWSPDSTYEANKIDVKYKTTKWKVDRLGNPAMSKVWEPSGDTMTIRSSQLTKDIVSDSTHIFLDKQEIKIWPFKGKVQIDGEIISYEGKQFVYHTWTATTDANGIVTYTNKIKHWVALKSADDFKRFNEKTPAAKRAENFYTGGLKIVERGIWNTEKRNHTINTTGWNTKAVLKGKTNQTVLPNAKGFKQNVAESTVTINTPPKMNDENDTFFAVRGTTGSSSYNSYGTKFRFNKDKASPTQIAGFAYQLSGAVENGYYIEVRTTASMSAANRSTSNEITVYSKVSGKNTIIAKGEPIAIGENIWYELDIYHSGVGTNNQKVSVFINGQLAAEGNTTAPTAQSSSGRFGFFARGKTNIDFEYAYAIARSVNEPLDDYGFYDLKYGGIRGGNWEREYVWDMRYRRRRIKKKRWTKEGYRHNQYFFDEFGPYVHEVREMDVKFDPSPVRYSYLFNTNDWYSAVPEYHSDPFGAKFIIANVARFHAVVHGEDNLIYAGSGSAVNQVCAVLGQNLEIADDETITKKNEPAIRRRGLIESELSSDWIQSKAMAEALATWMSEHWSDSVDQATVEIFGNPIIEIGDIVSVDYARENMTAATHVYFVVGTSTSFDNGIATKLTLRRRRTVPPINND